MTIVALAAIAELLWLGNNWREGEILHQRKMQEFEHFRDKSIENAAKLTTLLRQSKPFDRDVITLLQDDAHDKKSVLQRLDNQWDVKRFRRCIEILPLVRDVETKTALVKLLQQKCGSNAGVEGENWSRQLWMAEEDEGQNAGKKSPDPTFVDFKALIYNRLDPNFLDYFGFDKRSTVNLSEVRWGGVLKDSIPALDHPKMIAARQATYLNDSDIVYGIEVDGIERAYPKRILAWHELVSDKVGQVEVTATYCNLSGLIAVYRNQTADGALKFGNSGFLYRSNKLIYDTETNSLWSTLTGAPIVGDMCGKVEALAAVPVVTTTWQEWRKRHPDTLVLSNNTGHTRDYSEGAAYKEYLANDKVMFAVPIYDRKLANKADILALSWTSIPAVAIDEDLLRKKTIYQNNRTGKAFVVLTDVSGANRVYNTEVVFKTYKNASTLIDADGKEWTIDEDALKRSDNKATAPRLVANNCFWFAWQALYGDGLLLGADGDIRYNARDKAATHTLIK